MTTPAIPSSSSSSSYNRPTPIIRSRRRASSLLGSIVRWLLGPVVGSLLIQCLSMAVCMVGAFLMTLYVADLTIVPRSSIRIRQYPIDNTKPAQQQSQPLPPRLRDSPLLRKSSVLSSVTKMNPFRSHPPRPIELFAAEAPYIRQRHVCIQQLRQLHTEILGPFLPKDFINNQAAGSQESGSTTASSNATTTNHQPIPFLLVDPAYHSNVGDHMLTLGETVWMQRLGVPDYTPSTISVTITTTPIKATHLQCHYIQAGGFVPHCRDVLKQLIQKQQQQQQQQQQQSSLSALASTNTAVALWHAGGNWGDLWREAQTARIDSMMALLRVPGLVVIGMPQSLHYQNAHLEASDVTWMQRNIASAMKLPNLKETQYQQIAQRRIIFTWREKASYERALMLYPFATNLMVPDIAFQLGPYNANTLQAAVVGPPKVDFVVFLRNDKESIYKTQRNSESIQLILDAMPKGKPLRGNTWTFTIVDWPDRLQLFKDLDYFFTDTSIQLLAMGRVVICDRLHAAILAYLAGLPMVYLDQVSGKISKTFGTAMALTNITACAQGSTSRWARADNLTHALQLAQGMLSD